ncbi:hypothetical protein BDB01DRAFT_795092 [Pilobolus umbonatus]|nr:hypothetical protein BDB01DRAFT_795092 [Pilobolus umbonatus]
MNSTGYAVGDKCGITYVHQDHILLLPALILGYPDNENIEVLILTPISVDTVPCEYYFGQQQQCEATCPLYHSHGYIQPIEYVVPYNVFDTSDMLHPGNKIWYKEEGMELWKSGVLVDAMDDTCWHIEIRDPQTKKRKYITVQIENMIPYKSLDDEVSDEEESVETDVSDFVKDDSVKDDSVDILSTPSGWGEWQAHTTGFAAKMMKKMGYVEGKGLGIGGQGRIEPVEVNQHSQGDKPGLGFRAKKLEKKIKKKKEEEEVDMFGIMNSLLAPPPPKIDVKKKSVSTQPIAKLQSEVDRLHAEYIHASESYRRNKSTSLAYQFKMKLKKVHEQLEEAKKELHDRQKHIKQSKERQDMYTF